MPKLLNVGGGNVAVPPDYADWDVTLLDIDVDVRPDLWMDARRLTELEPGQFDAVFASHVLEHFYEHEVDGVLWGFYHVLTPRGFADVRVPDLQAVMKAVVERGYELTDVLYTSPVGPIRPLDVLFGYQKQVRESGTDYFQHKTGFSRVTLARALVKARFARVLLSTKGYDLRAVAYKWKEAV